MKPWGARFIARPASRFWRRLAIFSIVTEKPRLARAAMAI